jgi:imidazoleglycerol-phosphate dehydratase/histidinol-phosphatase
MRNIPSQRKKLYIIVDGPILNKNRETTPGFASLTAHLFPSLYRIAQSGRYEIHLIQKEPSKETLYPVQSLLSQQGIPIDGLHMMDDLAKQSHAEEKSEGFVVAPEPEAIASLIHAESVIFTDWQRVETFLLGSREQAFRSAGLQRKTKETDIFLSLLLDGTGLAEISTGLPFFDHMLDQIARHARFDIQLTCSGDVQVDEHHTVEDVAIVLGQAVAKALGDKRGINRYGFELLPMDDCLAEVALDFSGRSWFVWDVSFSRDTVGTFPTELFSHFFKSFSDEAKCNLHMKVSEGNAHHQAEALFKAFARALRSAVFRYPGSNDLPSTKGVL